MTRPLRILSPAAAALLIAIAGPAGAQPSGPSPAALAAVSRLAPYVPGPPVKGVIHLWGHGSFKRDFMGPLVDRWFAEFRRSQPGVALDYRMYGSASGIGALATGAANLVLLGEEISPDALRLFRRVKGYAPTRIEIANGSVDTNYFDYAHMIFVNRANPLARMDLDQLRSAFAANGTARRWGQFGLKGAWANKPITPYAWKTDIDFALFFRERVLGGDHRWNPATREFMPITRPDGSNYEHGQQILDALARDVSGIAISNVRFAGPGVKALPLSWRAGHAVSANDATLISRAYPLVRILPAYVDRSPGHPMNPVVREFLRFILSREGQRALIEDSGYLPLDRATQRDQDGRL